MLWILVDLPNSHQQIIQWFCFNHLLAAKNTDIKYSVLLLKATTLVQMKFLNVIPSNLPKERRSLKIAG